MLTFIATFSLIFLSEMGDKTQFIAMICSAKYGWKKVMTAIVIAVTSNHLLAVFFWTMDYSIYFTYYAFRWRIYSLRNIFSL